MNLFTRFKRTLRFPKTRPAERKLILHIGMPKTGTTTIQETLGQNTKTLHSAGFHYPEGKPFNHSNTFTPVFMDHPENTVYFKRNGIRRPDQIRHKLDELRKFWVREFSKSNNRTFIISAENLSKLRPHEIRRVREFLEPHFRNIRIMAYVRPPGAHIRSAWQQHVKTLSHGETKNELLQAVINSYNLDFLNQWAEVYGQGNLAVRHFHHDYFLGGNLLHDFMHAAAGQTLDLENIGQTNKSLGKWSTALLYEYNRTFPLFLDGELNPDNALADKLDIFFGILSRVEDEKNDFPIRFTDAQAAKINAQIETVNRFLDPKAAFSAVKPSRKQTEFPGISDMPNDYLINLIKEYNNVIDDLTNT